MNKYINIEESKFLLKFLTSKIIENKKTQEEQRKTVQNSNNKRE